MSWRLGRAVCPGWMVALRRISEACGRRSFKGQFDLRGNQPAVRSEPMASPSHLQTRAARGAGGRNEDYRG